MTRRLLVTMVEAAESLGISRTKMYDLVRRGEIAIVKLNRSSRVPVDELDRYVESARKRGLDTKGSSGEVES
jgi:excisionase family DNA binding protein